MAIKPVVVLALPAQSRMQMFLETDLAKFAESVTVIRPQTIDPAALYPSLTNAEICITGWGSPKFGPDLLTAAPKLRFVAHSAGGLKTIVTNALYDRGIRVTTAAAANAVPVAHFTIAQIISLLKQIPWLGPAMARNDTNEIARRKSHCRELMGMEVGIIGASRIGRLVIAMLHTYPSLTIKVYDPFLSTDEAKELGVVVTSLEEVCRCEVVTVHAPSVPATRHMLNARTLALLPDHAVLVNTARGALIDEAALIAEVRRRPLYVALDVTDPEPPLPDALLRRELNILLTPHIAGAMNQSRREMGRLAIAEVLHFIRGEMLPTQA
jgi:phosphoglycerate dehydrogenase-like enzyme